MVMADSLDDDQFWLPPQFLADDDITLDQQTCATNNKNDQNSLGFSPFEFGTFGRLSDFNSPDEALKGSSETMQRDEEDCVVGLTLGRVLSGSPQSTLCDMRSDSGCSQISSRGSPKGDWKPQSPPATWDLLHAVAEEARMPMNETHGVLHQNRGTSQLSVPVKNSTTGTGFYQKLHGPQFQHEMHSAVGCQQQHIHQMFQNGLSSSGGFLPPPQGSGMRTLFLGTQGGKRECAGTGFFSPRHTSPQSEERRKPACSTVLVPARVMKALNLKVEDFCSESHLQPVAGGRLNSENDVLLRLQINGRGGNDKKRNIRQQSTIDHEIKLPQEWTY